MRKYTGYKDMPRVINGLGIAIISLSLIHIFSSYKRLIDVYSSTAKTVDALMKLELSSGVEVEIKV